MNYELIGIELTQNSSGSLSIVTVFIITVYFCSRPLPFFKFYSFGRQYFVPLTMLDVFTYLISFHLYHALLSRLHYHSYTDEDTDGGKDNDLARIWAELTPPISAINLHSKFITKLSTGEDFGDSPPQSPTIPSPVGDEERNEQ